MRTRRGRDQGWALPMLLGGGIEGQFGGLLGYYYELGFKYIDLAAAAASAVGPAMLRKRLAAIAEQRFAAAHNAESDQHMETARDEYHRAALLYGLAQWWIFEDTAEKRELHNKCIAAYEKLAQFSPYTIEKVTIPFNGGNMYGWLQLPPGMEKAPCLLYCPGLDQIKEYFPNPRNNIFVQRGLAVLTLDGPGHGESRLNGGLHWQVNEEADNYAAAGSAALDYLASRSDIDATRVGAFGCSQGSYWAPIMVMHDKRFKALATMMGSFYEQGFDLGWPLAKENLMFLLDAESEAEVDEALQYVTLDGKEDRIHCPLMVLHGEFDEFVLPEDAKRFVERSVNAPSKELHIYEDEWHALAGVAPEAYNRVADWISDQLLC